MGRLTAGEGVWGRVQVGVGSGLLVGNERKQKGVGTLGAGVGTGKGTDKPMRMRLSKRPFFSKLTLIGENQKGTAGRGRGKKCHDNLRQTSRQFTTF